MYLYIQMNTQRHFSSFFFTEFEERIRQVILEKHLFWWIDGVVLFIIVVEENTETPEAKLLETITHHFIVGADV